MNYFNKYIKYKSKYCSLKNKSYSQYGGGLDSNQKNLFAKKFYDALELNSLPNQKVILIDQYIEENYPKPFTILNFLEDKGYIINANKIKNEELLQLHQETRINAQEKLNDAIPNTYEKNPNTLEIIENFVESNYGDKLKSIESLPAPYAIIKFLYEHKIPVAPEPERLKKVKDIHFEISNLLFPISELTYRTENRLINNFKYAILCQGRYDNRGMNTIKNIIFYNDMTNDNTFYIDIQPKFKPDSISNLNEKDAIIIYNGNIFPFNSFDTIAGLGCGWEGGHVFAENFNGSKANRILLENLYKYLKSSGKIQITPIGITDKLDYTNVNDLFDTYIDKDNDSVFLTKK